MAGGKIRHWKHGWIPLTPAALRYKEGRGPRPQGNETGGTLTNAERRKIINMEREARGEKPLPARGRVDTKKKTQADRISDTLAKGRNRPVNREAQRAEDRMKAREARIQERVDASVAEWQAEAYDHYDVKDGVEFVTYVPGKDPLGTEHGNPYQFTDAQREVLADAYNRVMKDFPGAEPVQIVGVDGKTGAFGITSWDGRRISISSDLFDDARRKNAEQTWGDHGAIAGQYAVSPDAFARATLIHELGHALQMQKGEARAFGREMAYERLIPSDLGITIPPEEDLPDLVTRIKPSETSAPRWMVDTLDLQSVYATGNEFEWFAEAFADGWLNRGGATLSGKRAVEGLRRIYAKEAAAA